MRTSTAIPNHSPITIGMIGLGLISRLHLEAYQARDDVVIAALSDTNHPRLSQVGSVLGIQALYPAYETMLDDQRLDVVDVLTPHYLHVECVTRALAKHMTVICEKPVAINVDDLDRMIAAARNSGRHIYIKQYLRHSLAYQKMRNVLEKGEIGKPYYIQCVFTSNSIADYVNPYTWRGNKKEAGGGVFMDVGEHMLDLLQSVFGSPRTTYAQWNNVSSTLPQKGEDFISALIEFPNQLMVNMTCTENDIGYNFRWEVKIYGTNGVMTIVDHGKLEKRLQVIRDNTVVYEFVEEDWWQMSNLRAMHDIVDRIRDMRLPEVSLTHARSVLDTILGTYQSAQTGKKIHLK